MRWQSTDGSLAEILSFDAEGMGETGTIVFPGNDGSEFYQFGIIESLAQAGKEHIRHFYGSVSYGVGVFENEALDGREVEISSIVPEIGDLLG